jgi:16S rRNA processing protein RimM
MSPRRPGPINRKSNNTGSPAPGEPVFVIVGQLRKPHGVHGEILMEILTSFPQRLRAGKIVYVGDNYAPMEIKTRRAVEKGMLLTFDGFDDCDQVAVLTNRSVFVPTDTLPPLPDGEYYHHQLIGLSVIDPAGVNLGEVVEIIETGANDVYVVRSADGKEILLPAITEVLLKVDLAAGSMQVRPPEWL